MRKEHYLDRTIGIKLVEENQKRDEQHKSSGKLSASMLGKPVQWQVLKTLGVKRKPIDEYVVRKFLRGESIEQWLLGYIEGLKDKQVFVEYRDCIGYCDALVDSEKYDHKVGVIPHEIKSVSNAKFKNIVKAGIPDKGHLLQGCLYALGLGTEFFAIDYVASDDLRVETFVIPTKEYEDEVNSSINDYQKAMREWKRNKVLPVFEAKEKWQEDYKYSDYPDFAGLSGKECTVLFMDLFEKGLIK